jgi:ADP-ribose pyrophosphatase YjhB (NUDIX family)
MYRDLFKKYIPKSEQEERDLKLILDFIQKNDDALNRNNLAAHITSSAFVLNKDLTKVLFAFHNIYQSWSWVGGHNDLNPNLLEVAIKEAKEETGVVNIKPYSEDIFTIDVIYVSNHIKHGQYVPDHLHLNASFLLIADESDPLAVQKDENSDVRWFLIEEVKHYVSEPRMIPVYEKAFKIIKNLKKIEEEI